MINLMSHLLSMSRELIEQQISKMVSSAIISFIAACSYNPTSSVWKGANDVTLTLSALIYSMCLLTVFIYMQSKDLFLVYLLSARSDSVESDTASDLADFNNILSQPDHHLIFFWNVAWKYLFDKQFMLFIEFFSLCSYSKKVSRNHYSRSVIHWILNKQFNFRDDIISIQIICIMILLTIQNIQTLLHKLLLFNSFSVDISAVLSQFLPANYVDNWS